MKKKLNALVACAMLAGLAPVVTPAAMAQVAGGTTVGVTITVNQALAKGWSAKHTILKHKVLGDNGKPIGYIDDIIIDPDQKLSMVILHVGSPLSFAGKLIALPVEQIKVEGDHLVLPGATPETLKQTPPFEYAH